MTKNEAQTKRLAGQVLKELFADKANKKAKILALEGELGAGKTTFTQGLAKALGVKEKITSPTFVIMKRFIVNAAKLFPERAARSGASRRVSIENLYHIDCYRIQSPKELSALGFNEIAANPKNIIIIEWAEKIKKLISKDATWVRFEWVGDKERRISLKNF